MNTEELCEWQKIDEENGLVMPWFTWDSLDWIKKQDWSDKVVLMFGAGLGDAWLSKRCKKLYVVERTNEWLEKSKQYSLQNNCDVTYIYRPCADCTGEDKFYLDIRGIEPDVIINDDAYRTECCQMAVDYFKERQGVFITDNFDQDYVFISPKALEIMAPYENTRQTFIQQGHTNHEGKPWNTTIWTFNEIYDDSHLTNLITGYPDYRNG